MRVYISGAISGTDDYEERFAKREAELRQLGYIPINPVKIGKLLRRRLNREPTHEEYLKEDLKELKKCEAINFLQGWKESKGANREYQYAIENEKIVLKIKLFSHKR